jgi:hypothetical protein
VRQEADSPRSVRGRVLRGRRPWLDWSRKTRIAAAVVVVIALGAAGAAAWLYTPDRNVEILNDGTTTVEITTCGDPEAIAPGSSATVQTDSGGPDECDVYSGEGQLQGCIQVRPQQAVVRLRALTSCDGAR